MAEQMHLAARLPPNFDPFGDAFLADPYPHHEILRDAGPLVFLEAYDAWGLKKFMGREYMGISRATFVIDKTGTLKHVDYRVKAKGHAAAMLELVKQLD